MVISAAEIKKKIMVLVGRIISYDHAIKDSCDILGRSSSRYITILSILVAIGTLVVKI